jgi:radical SAM protein with 4Fe4S-binding SPASM domain
MQDHLWWKRLKPNIKRVLPKPGIYHYVNQTGENKNRIHLRIEKDGAGLLLINAARAYHLNPSTTSMAYWSLSGGNKEEIIQSVKKNFQINEKIAESDTVNFLGTFSNIINPDDHCPICEMDLDVDLPFSNTPSAPYRMDLAVTYRCNNDCSHCYNARSRKFPEKSTKDWYRIIDKLWNLGIPHIVFTGGEPTLRSDLPDLIAYAEKKGQITGINTNGRKLSDKFFLQSLIDSGLDHIQITLESSDPNIHDLMVNRKGAWAETINGIQNAVAAHVYMMTNTTMLATNVSTIPSTLDLLAELNVPTVGLNALIYSGKGENVGTGLEEKELSFLLDVAKEKTITNNQKLIWYTPTDYCNFNPITNELGVKGCTAALYNMCIEPDGSVLPCQSYYQSLGNILTESWDSIWNHDISRQLRERRNLPAKCNNCELIIECGGGCPLTHMKNALN